MALEIQSLTVTGPTKDLYSVKMLIADHQDPEQASEYVAVSVQVEANPKVEALESLQLRALKRISELVEQAATAPEKRLDGRF